MAPRSSEPHMPSASVQDESPRQDPSDRGEPLSTFPSPRHPRLVLPFFLFSSRPYFPLHSEPVP